MTLSRLVLWRHGETEHNAAGRMQGHFDSLLTDTGCATNGFDNFDKIWFWRTPTSKCEAEGNCVPYSQWDKEYRKVMGQ